MSGRVEQVESFFGLGGTTQLLEGYELAQAELEAASVDYRDRVEFERIEEFNAGLIGLDFLGEPQTRGVDLSEDGLTPYKRLTHKERENLKYDWGLKDGWDDESLGSAEEAALAQGDEFTDEDLEEFVPRALVPHYRRVKEAEVRLESAGAEIKDTAVAAGLDELALWSVMNVCTNRRRGWGDIKTLAALYTGRIDALDGSLRAKKGTLITYIGDYSFVSSGPNDGKGLRFGANQRLTLNRLPEPSYGVLMHDSLGVGPNIFKIREQGELNIDTVARDELAIGTWPDIYDIKGWRDDTHQSGRALFFGEPTDGKLNIWRVNNPDAKEYYSEAIRRARLAAELAMGNLTLKDLQKAGLRLQISGV